ncbi:Alpha/Beta hydrolase protein [Syncephalastrum racemosum]|uniref:Pheromone-processing carboxypeptidase KEX1 n=1 Tax=Syncephalastrum racemosum TaxID=13706 RepID=A0A1X2HVK7_SYNRA|nr:Alpha/Beta hydrolase protein [Syncephalastrum racemosum]
MWRRSFLGWLSLAMFFISRSAAQTADQYLVTSLPGLADNNLKQYAGHVEVAPETNGNIFFWMIEQTHTTTPEKLIIWLNGGPGCSSMDGLFLENGPYRVNPDLTLNTTLGGWQEYATVVFVDQPVGTGFSFADLETGYMHNLTQIAEEFTVFLDKFLTVFPDLQERDMYLAGESFAGTYIPYLAARILDLNQRGQADYNLKGIAIGNGWISPKHQYDAYYDFALQNDLLSPSYKTYAESNMEQCHKKQEEVGIRISEKACESILQAILDDSVHEKDGEKYCINQYDIRLKNEPAGDCGATWPHELEDVTTYLRQNSLVEAVHASKQAVGWTECAGAVGSKLDRDSGSPSFDLLPGLLKEIPVLLFSGDKDLICNYLGTEYLIGNMTWNGAQGFGASTKKESWYIDDVEVGSYQEARNLTFVMISEGSHMVPYDKPAETRDMINRFMGVGNNMINGSPSWVGDNKPSTNQPSSSAPADTDLAHDDEDLNDNIEQKPTGETEGQEPPEDKDEWAQYYSWGTSALIVVILFAAIAGYCFYRSRKTSGNADYDYRSQSSTGWFAGLLGLFGRNKRQKTKLRLGDHDDTNELDELVIETPTLFAAEDYSDQDHTPPRTASPSTQQQTNSHKPSTRFAIADGEESDDDFEDFAEWEEDDSAAQETTPAVKKKDGKKE